MLCPDEPLGVAAALLGEREPVSTRVRAQA